MALLEPKVCAARLEITVISAVDPSAMILHVFAGGKRFFTKVATVRFVTGVGPDVDQHIALLTVCFAAKLAGKRLHSSVGPHVASSLGYCPKHLVAEITGWQHSFLVTHLRREKKKGEQKKEGSSSQVKQRNNNDRR